VVIIAGSAVPDAPVGVVEVHEVHEQVARQLSEPQDVDPCGSENPVMSRDLHILVYETAEPVSSQWSDCRAGGRGVRPAGGCLSSDR
jgi:hypothetical protein